MPVIDCHNHAGVELMAYLRGELPYGQMLPQMVSEGRTAGLTHWVVFPMVSNLALDITGMREGIIRTEGALEPVPYAWENRRLLEELHRQYPDYRPFIFPFAMLDPSRNPGGQIKALRTLKSDYPLYGLKIQSTILQSSIRTLLDGGQLFLDLAREWKLPFIIHSSVHPKDPWAQAGDILDVVEQAPDINFCVAHSCRFDRIHLDRLAQMPNAWFDCSAHIIHCRLAGQDALPIAARARRFDSDYARPEVVLRDLAEAYPGKLMWGSDSPYYTFVSRDGMGLFCSYAEEGACLHSLPQPLLREVSFTNTQRCFRLPLEEERG